MKLYLFIIILFCINVVAANAQEVPKTEDVESSVLSRLPSGWVLKKLDITASVNEGDAINPVVRQRFVATVESAEDLYQLANKGQIGPFTVVILTTKKTDVKSLYGTLRAPFSAGKWNIEVVFENDLRTFGLTESAIGRPLIIAGSPEANKRMQEVAKAEELTATLARLRNEGKVKQEALKSELEASLLKLRIEGETNRTELTTKIAAGLAAISTEGNALQSAAQRRVKDAISAIDASAKIKEQLEAVKKDTELLAKLEAAEKEKAVQLRKTEAAKASQDKIKAEELAFVYRDLLNGLKSKDAAVGQAAFEKALASPNRLIRSSAVEFAAKSKLSSLRHLALLEKVKSSATLSIKFYNKENSFLMEFPIGEFQKKENSSSIKVERNDIVRVSVSGGTVNATRMSGYDKDDKCNVSLSLAADNVLRGSGSCLYGGSTHSLRVPSGQFNAELKIF